MKNKLKTLALTALLAFSPLEKTIAQDFYNGVKGPRTVQIDNYANFSKDNRSCMVIPKFFVGYVKGLPDLLFAVPFSISEKGKIENKGFNTGYITENFYKKTNAILAIGLFKDGNGNYNVLNPQIYLNKDMGNVSIDLETALPINIKNHKKGWHTAATFGYGLTDRLRVGGSVIKDKDKKLEYQGNIRFEIKKNHKYWLQTYISKRSAGIRFVANF